MIIQVQWKDPEGGPFHLELPEFIPAVPHHKQQKDGEQQFSESCSGAAAVAAKKEMQEWVWKHGKEQLLSKLQFQFVPHTRTATKNGCCVHKADENQESYQSVSEDSERSESYSSSNPTMAMSSSRLEMSDSSYTLDVLLNNNNPSVSAGRKGGADPGSGRRSSRRREPPESHQEAEEEEEEEQEEHSPQTREDKDQEYREGAIAAESPDYLRRRLDLMEGLQKVQREFLESEQKKIMEEKAQPSAQDDPKSGKQKSSGSPVDKAFNNLLDSVVTWSGCDYGLIARVEELRNDKDDDDKLPLFELKKFASLNVPTYSLDQSQTDQDDDSSSSSSSSSSSTDGDDSDCSSVDNVQRRPPRRPPQPVTTYGPVYYKSIVGSATLMMDQIRFEPRDPLDLMQRSFDSDDEDEDLNASSDEYNNISVYWDKVVKYQLTPKTSSKHLFKLITTTGGRSNAANNKKKEVVLKMTSRAELERIAQDVKARVVLPSKRPSDKAASGNIKRKRTKKHKKKDPKKELSQLPARPLLTPQQRSAMLPPNLPRRMTSERKLLQGSTHSNHNKLDRSDNHNRALRKRNAAAAPPFHPVRRTTHDSIEFVSDNDSDSDDGQSHSSGSDSEDEKEEQFKTPKLWAVEDVIRNLLTLKEPLILGPGKRDRWHKLQWEQRKKIATENGGETDKDEEGVANDEDAKCQLLLLPPQWQTLVAIPYYCNDTIIGVIVIANSTEEDDASASGVESKNFLGKEAVSWWGPAVVTMCKDFLQQKRRLEQLAEKSRILKDLQLKLQDSLRRQKEMILDILPPMALSKIKTQPQQWKSPLQFPTVSPSVTQSNSADICSFQDSSISGSITSRYGMMVRCGSTAHDSETNSKDADYYLYSLSEGEEKQDNPVPSKAAPVRSNSSQALLQPLRPVPSRSSSSNNMGAALRMHRQSSVTNRSVGRSGLFSRMDSAKNGMLMMPGSSHLVRFDSGRFGKPGIPRLNSLRSLHGNISINTSNGSSSVDTMDQSWRTMYTSDESLSSINPDDLPKTRANSVKSKDGTSNEASNASNITVDTTIRYVNNGESNVGMSTVQALYAAHKPNVAVLFISAVNVPEVGPDSEAGEVMDILAKLLFSLDHLCAKYSTIKVETYGTTILVMSGLFTEETDKDDDDADEGDTYGSFSRDRKCASNALDLAKEIVSIAQTIPLSTTTETATSSSSVGSGKKTQQQPETLILRAGIHIGKVTYGVIGQTVPKLVCFGEDILVAARMEQTARDNCIRASKAFHDFVGKDEKGWDDGTEVIDLIRKAANQDSATTALMSSTSSFSDGTVQCLPPSARLKGNAAPMETYTLEPPPPAISDAFSQSYSSCASSFPSLSPWGSSEFFSNDGGGNMLDVPLEESFVSGEFYVD